MDLHHAFAELGLTLQATPAEAKVAYRTLAMRCHPDISPSPGAEARMKTINVAYAAVSAHLDLRNKPAAVSKSPSAAQRPAGGHGASTASGFSEFDWKTGFAARATATPRERLVQRTVQVSLFEAAFGCVKRVRGTVSGTGRSALNTWLVEVRIHPGSQDGMEIAPVDIRACPSMHPLPRTLRLAVQIEKHPLFRLDKDRLSVTVPMSLWRWALGGALTVPTLDGSVRLNLAPRSGVVLLRDMGWPQFKQPQQKGPLFVMPQRVLPESLSDEDRRLLQALDAGVRLPEVDGWNHSVQNWMHAVVHGKASRTV